MLRDEDKGGRKKHNWAQLYWGYQATWRRPPGRPRQTWTQTIEKDLNVLSIGLHMVWNERMQDREQWRGSGYAPTQDAALDDDDERMER